MSEKVLGWLRAVVLFRLRGVRYEGRPILIGRRPRIDGAGDVRVGASFKVVARRIPVELGAGPGGELRLGDRVFVNQGVTLRATSSIVVGDDVRFADLSCVYDTDFHEVVPGAGVRIAPVVIEDGAWIGRGAIVLPGVTVGRHAIVAAGAVVTKDVAAATVVAGNPARVVRELEIPAGYRRP